MFALAKKCGAKFTFGSDAHSIAGHRDYNMWCDKAVDLFNIEETDIAGLPQKAEQ